MNLTSGQKRQLLEDGYVTIPGAVPAVMVKEAMKAINHSIGKGIPANHRGANYCKELEKNPVITDLFNGTPVKSLVDSLIGEGDYDGTGSAQIALRFPDYADASRTGRERSRISGATGPAWMVSAGPQSLEVIPRFFDGPMPCGCSAPAANIRTRRPAAN